MLNAIIYTWGAVALYVSLFFRTRYYRVLEKQYIFIAQRKRHFFGRWESLSGSQSTTDGAYAYIYNDISKYHMDGIEDRVFNQYVRILPIKKDKSNDDD